MGQALSDALGDSPPPHDTLDPGPLSDAELAEALKRFAEHATDGALAQGAFDAIAENKQDDFAAAARHASFYDAARARAPTVDKRAFVAFCGVATRGSRSRRLEHVVTAGLGVRTLSDACDAAQTKRLAALMFSLVGAEPSPAVERALSMYEDAGACARWCDRNAPGLADAYAAWARRRFLDDARPAPTIPAASGLLAPASVRACLLLSDVRTYGGLLRPLYASSKDGWSFQRLCREILGWAGPTLLVARAGARTFGVLADEAWRDDRKPFGAGGCRLYTFAPAFAVARPRAGQSQDLLYLNTKGSASVPKGLIIGDGAVHVPTELGDARIEIARFLIESGADVNLSVEDGTTPLVHAIAAGHHDGVRLLLDARADIHAKTKNGTTALEVAIDQDQEGSHDECIKLLRACGAVDWREAGAGAA